MNMKRHSGILLVGVLLGSLPFFAHAQYAEDALRFSQYGAHITARGAAMGGVGVGVSDDFSALYMNPAGLAQVRSYEFSVGLNRRTFDNDVSYFNTVTPGSSSETSLSHIGLVYPIPTKRGSLTFAFGYGRVADFSSIATIEGTNPSSSVIESLIPTASDEVFDRLYNWLLIDPAESGGGYVPLVGLVGGIRQNITVLEGGGINHWTIGGAVDIARDISLGGSLNFVSGSYSYDRQFVETDPDNIYYRYVPRTSTDFDLFRFESSIKSDLSGFNALFGVMFRRGDKIRVGATVRTPTNFEISETFSDLYELQTDTSGIYGPEAYSNTTKYKIVTPTIFSLGVSVMPFDWLLLAGDAEYTDWTQVQFDTDNPDLIQENRDIKTKIFRETWNLRAGGELTLWDLGIRLRGGVGYNPSPFKADASISERDQVFYTGGIGLMVDDRTSFDVGYAYGQWKTLRDNYSLSRISRASRTDENVTTGHLTATLSYRF